MIFSLSMDAQTLLGHCTFNRVIHDSRSLLCVCDNDLEISCFTFLVDILLCELANLLSQSRLFL